MKNRLFGAFIGMFLVSCASSSSTLMTSSLVSLSSLSSSVESSTTLEPLYFTGFETFEHTNTAESYLTIDGFEWHTKEVRSSDRGSMTLDHFEGLGSLRGSVNNRYPTDGYAEFSQGFANPTRISFLYANYGTTNQGRLRLLMSRQWGPTENATFITIFIQETVQNTLTEVVINIADFNDLATDIGTGLYRFKFVFTLVNRDNQTPSEQTRINIDNVRVD